MRKWKLHHDMLRYSEKDVRHKGHYKFGSNLVEAKDRYGDVVGVIFDPTAPHLVKKEMHELTDWYHWALDNQVNRKDAIEALGFAPRTVEQLIKKLVELKCLEGLGQGKGTRYRMITS